MNRFDRLALATLPLLLAASAPGCSGPAMAPVPDAAPAVDAAPADAPDDTAPAAPPDIISTSPLTASDHEASIAVTADGRVVVCWTGIQGATYNIYYRISPDAGATWGAVAALPLPPDDNTASNASLLARRDGTLWIAWASEAHTLSGRTNVRIWAASSAPGAATFGAPSVVREPGGTSFVDLPYLAEAADGALLLTWAEFPSETAPNNLFAARSTDGAAWTVANVTSADPHAFRNVARTCTAGRRTYLTYYDQAQGIALRWSDDGGATWPTSALISVLDSSDDDPVYLPGRSCVARGDEVFVMYARSADPGSSSFVQKLDHIRLAHSSDDGATIDRNVDVQDDTQGSYFLAANMALSPDGSLDVAYYAGGLEGDANGSYRRARSTDDGMTFGPSVAVAQPVLFTTTRTGVTWIGDYAGLYATDGALYGAYTDNNQGQARIAFYRVAMP